MASPRPSTANVADNGAEGDKDAKPTEDEAVDKPVSLQDVLPAHEWESQRSTDSEVTVHAEEHDTWLSQLDFYMAVLSTAVGLGNVWRFPFVAYRNGGGAFLIPYVVVLLCVGRPLYLLELIIGQFSSRSSVAIWSCSPMFRGVGYASLVIAGCTGIYYMAILGTCVIYLINSFRNPLPWADCDHKFYTREHEGKTYFKNFTCHKTYGIGLVNAGNVTREHKSVNPELFYYYKVQKILDNINDGIGTPLWENTLCYLLIWILGFITAMLGAKSVGRAAYFTAIFPYIILFILFGRAICLAGAVDGIILFFKPKIGELASAKVWYEAIQQCFFSLGLGYSVVITYGSYNKFSQPLFMQTTVIALVDTLTSVLAGATVFAILGALAKTKNQRVEDVVPNGAGLAFVSYPDLLLTFQKVPYLAQTFSVLFFAMLLTVGIGSGTSYVTAICASFYDRYPALNTKRSHKIGVVALLILAFFFLGLVFVTPGGLYMIELVDTFAAGFIVYITVCIETIGLCYGYGINNIIRDMKFMFKQKDTKFSKVIFALYEIWGLGIPIFLVGVIVFFFAQKYEPPSIELFWSQTKIQFPPAAIAAGWTSFAVIISLIPAFALKVVVTRKTSTWKKKIVASWRPTRRWGPSDPKIYTAWMDYKASYTGTSFVLTTLKTFKDWISSKIRKPKQNEPDVKGEEASKVDSVDPA